MQLEEYFDFLAPNDIRIRGHRIGIESVLIDYLDMGLTAEAIHDRYPHLSVEHIYATILYYLRNVEDVQAYLQDYRDSSRRRRERFATKPPAFVRHLQNARREPAAAVDAKGTRAA